MSCVMQDWVHNLTFMQQSVLITACRGADGLPKYHISKYVMRWLRRCYMRSAFDNAVILDPYDPRGGNFTGPIPDGMSLPKLADSYLAAIDEVPHHFHLHLVHAAEILGYKHPNLGIRGFWHVFYQQAVSDMHMRPESEYDMDRRLGDNKEQWEAHGGEVLDDERV